MTDKKRKTRSLKLSFVLTLAVALFIAISVYLVFEVVATAMIDNIYLSDENRDRREESYVADLQRYITERGLTGEDTEDFARWAQSNRYVYLMIYKDDQLFFDSGSYEPTPEPMPTPTPEPDGTGKDDASDEENGTSDGGSDSNPEDDEDNTGTPDGENPGGEGNTDTPDGENPDGEGNTGTPDGENPDGDDNTDTPGDENPDGENPDGGDAESNPGDGMTEDGTGDSDGTAGGDDTTDEGGESEGVDENESDGDTETTPEEPTDKPQDKPTDKPGTGTGITVRFPTREELMKYAEENDAHIVNTADDSVLVVNMADFTEYFYYDIVNITSIVFAMIALFIVILIHYNGVTTRISALAKDVRVIAGGDMEHRIKASGSDEISELSTNVEDMRSAILENIAKERDIMEANAELIKSMSHDIRTPLTVLLGYIDIMKDKVAGDAQMTEYIEASEKTALRLKKLSDDLFGYFLLFGSGAASAVLEEYDVGMLLQQMLSEHILLLRESGYEVGVEKGEELDARRILTDPADLVRIFENIFSNIMKYADKSAPVSIFAEIKDGKLRLKFHNKIARVHYAESNGIGLKTCKKLAQRLSAEIEWRESEDEFEVELTFDIVRA